MLFITSEHAVCICWSPRTKEEVFLSLGPGWFLLLLQGHLHPSTNVLGLKLLLHFLSSPSLCRRFKDGLPAGSWVERCAEGSDILMGAHGRNRERLLVECFRGPYVTACISLGISGGSEWQGISSYASPHRAQKQLQLFSVRLCVLPICR